MIRPLQYLRGIGALGLVSQPARPRVYESTQSPNDYRAYRKNAAFGSLDGLRCLCILAVIWHHASPGEHSWRLLDRGFLGVDLFFVISGFLIVTLLLRERSATGGISLQKFYIRRTLRIFPLYYTVILGLAAMYTTVGRHSDYGERFLSDLPFYLTYTADLVPVALAIVWSLAAEEQFYLLWPSIERYLSKQVIPILIVLIALNQVVNFAGGKTVISGMVGGMAWAQLSIFQTTFTPILLGVAAAHLLHSEAGYRAIGWLVLSRWSPAVYLAAILITLMLLPADISGSPRLIVQLGMTMLLVSCVYREDHVLRPALRFFPIQRVGQISYGMYLFHILIIGAAAHYVKSSVLFVVGLALTIIIAELSFRYFESPILRLKRGYSVVHQAHA